MRGAQKNSEIKNHPKVVLGNDFGNKGAECLQTLIPIDSSEEVTESALMNSNLIISQ